MTLIYSTRSTWRLPLLGLLVWLTALVACSHDSKRDNPLDPELTPAVELQVALDDSAGTATLTWTPYDGETSFTMYWVLRKVPGLETVDTLAAINDVQVTSHEDDTLRPNTSYSYRVSVVNVSGFEFSSQEQTVEGYSASPVTLFEHEVASDEVRLRWSRFSGGKFEAYRVEPIQPRCARFRRDRPHHRRRRHPLHRPRSRTGDLPLPRRRRGGWRDLCEQQE